MSAWLPDNAPIEPPVRKERTGWRDEEISARHRIWGWNCPAVDLDFLMVEYNIGKPVGVIEYKHARARMPNMQHPTYRALCELADMSALPFMVVFYYPPQWAFKVHPVNAVARQNFAEGQMMTERQFVMSLYRMRRLTLASHLADKLNDELPDEAA
jgi:hypothetical protein